MGFLGELVHPFRRSEEGSPAAATWKGWGMSRHVIKHQELPDESERFLEIDDDVKQLLRRGFEAWPRLKRCYEFFGPPELLR